MCLWNSTLSTRLLLIVVSLFSVNCRLLLSNSRPPNETAKLSVNRRGLRLDSTSRTSFKMRKWVLGVGRGDKIPVKCHKRVKIPQVEVVKANKTMSRASHTRTHTHTHTRTHSFHLSHPALNQSVDVPKGCWRPGHFSLFTCSFLAICNSAALMSPVLTEAYLVSHSSHYETLMDGGLPDILMYGLGRCKRTHVCSHLCCWTPDGCKKVLWQS